MKYFIGWITVYNNSTRFMFWSIFKVQKNLFLTSSHYALYSRGEVWSTRPTALCTRHSRSLGLLLRWETLILKQMLLYPPLLLNIRPGKYLLDK